MLEKENIIKENGKNNNNKVKILHFFYFDTLYKYLENY